MKKSAFFKCLLTTSLVVFPLSSYAYVTAGTHFSFVNNEPNDNLVIQETGNTWYHPGVGKFEVEPGKTISVQPEGVCTPTMGDTPLVNFNVYYKSNPSVVQHFHLEIDVTGQDCGGRALTIDGRLINGPVVYSSIDIDPIPLFGPNSTPYLKFTTHKNSDGTFAIDVQGPSKNPVSTDYETRDKR